ncbi:hypothetical protein KSF_097210 [Reticulibacter mediterranei]|uniref:Uncharacterized protein n=1 Tax=Reticulibacter mediterranei TaxID=2778369 RepID=A0A8J3IW77_9CHLR|nr:hypothetical protein KSF_097210 [Reticulibacter mediterranei]
MNSSEMWSNMAGAMAGPRLWGQYISNYKLYQNKLVSGSRWKTLAYFSHKTICVYIYKEEK